MALDLVAPAAKLDRRSTRRTDAPVDLDRQQPGRFAVRRPHRATARRWRRRLRRPARRRTDHPARSSRRRRSESVTGSAWSRTSVRPATGPPRRGRLRRFSGGATGDHRSAAERDPTRPVRPAPRSGCQPHCRVARRYRRRTARRAPRVGDAKRLARWRLRLARGDVRSPVTCTHRGPAGSCSARPREVEWRGDEILGDGRRPCSAPTAATPGRPTPFPRAYSSVPESADDRHYGRRQDAHWRTIRLPFRSR